MRILKRLWRLAAGSHTDTKYFWGVPKIEQFLRNPKVWALGIGAYLLTQGQVMTFRLIKGFCFSVQ